MARGPLHDLIKRLRWRADAPGTGGVTDGELLRRFAGGWDEAAFELLVWRHGAMVYNTCCRVLGHTADAEDAFQATFLALVRKAGAIRDGHALPGWLHLVAHRAALRIQQAACRRARHEQPGLPSVAAPVADELAGRELGVILEQEVARLPEPMRVAFVLCHLEGRTAEEAAAQVGCPQGTVESRLSRARERLRARLTRRGLELPAALATAPALPASLVLTTLQSAGHFAAGQADGVIPSRVVSTTHGVLRAMSLTKLTRTALIMLLVAVVALGGVLAHLGLVAGQRPAPPPRPVAEAAAIKLPTREKGLDRVEVIASPDGKLIVTDGRREKGQEKRNGEVFPVWEKVTLVWESATGKLVHTITAPTGYGIETVAFSPDGKTLATPDGGGTITLHEVDTWKVKATWKHPEVAEVAFTPDGETLASLSRGGEATLSELKLWDVATGRERVSLKWAEEAVLYSTAMGISPDGKQVAVGMSGGAVRLIEVATGKEGKPLAAAIAKSTPLFAPDGKTLFTWATGGGSDDKELPSVKVWDPATGKLLRTFEVAKGYVRDVVLSPDGKTLAVASDDKGGVALFDPTSGKRQAVLTLTEAPKGEGLQLAFSPDGKILAASGREEWSIDKPTRPLTRFFSLADRRGTAALKGTRSVTFLPRGGKAVLVAGEIGIVRNINEDPRPDEVTLRDVADLVPARRE